MTTLLAVAHGTADPDGLAELQRLADLVRTGRPAVPVELAWLERAAPLLPSALAALSGPVVVVPLLLSTGYHVKVDITAAVADRPRTVVARQLGPDDRITRVVLERLTAAGGQARDVVLFGAGSSDPEALEQLQAVAARLQGWLREREGSVEVFTRTLVDDGWQVGLPERLRVANYLLAPGRFNDVLGQRAVGLESPTAAPIGAHPALAAVVWDRYDEALAELPASG